MLQEGEGEKSLRYRILITEDEDGEFVAECPSLPGDPVPPSICEDIVEVNI